MQFTRENLKNGMAVELRNGMKFLYMKGRFVGKDIYNTIDYYDDNLLSLSKEKLDIVKVYDVNWKSVNFLEDIFNNLILIWEREKKEYPILTKYQFELLKRLNNDFNWIARNEIGELFLYSGNVIPYKSQGSGYWQYDDGTRFSLFDCLDDFDFVKREDKQPWNIKELLDNCEVEK